MQQGCAPRLAAMPADRLEVIDIELGILPNLQRETTGGRRCIWHRNRLGGNANVAGWIEASPLDRRQIVESWLKKFSSALEEKRYAAAAAMFTPTVTGATC